MNRHTLPKDDAWRHVTPLSVEALGQRLWLRCDACGHDLIVPAVERGLRWAGTHGIIAPNLLDEGAAVEQGWNVSDGMRKSSAGLPRSEAGAEGATAPETLRHTDRMSMTLWKAARHIAICRAHRRM